MILSLRGVEFLAYRRWFGGGNDFIVLRYNCSFLASRFYAVDSPRMCIIHSKSLTRILSFPPLFLVSFHRI